jgi:lysyl-tRNA synthetase class II
LGYFLRLPVSQTQRIAHVSGSPCRLWFSTVLPIPLAKEDIGKDAYTAKRQLDLGQLSKETGQSIYPPCPTMSITSTKTFCDLYAPQFQPGERDEHTLLTVVGKTAGNVRFYKAQIANVLAFLLLAVRCHKHDVFSHASSSCVSPINCFTDAQFSLSLPGRILSKREASSKLVFYDLVRDQQKVQVLASEKNFVSAFALSQSQCHVGDHIGKCVHAQ